MVDLILILLAWAKVYPHEATFLFVLGLFYGYVYYAGVVHAWPRMLIGQKILAIIPLIIFGVADVLFRCTFGVLMFFELPTMATITFSKQCESHMGEPGWRGAVADAYCFLLNTFIPNHCQRKD